MADLSADFPQDSQLDKYDEQMLENGQGLAASEPSMALSGSDILHKLSFSLLNSLQQPAAAKQAQQGPIMEMVTEAIASTQMDFDVMPNHVVIDSSTFGGMDEMQKQLQYDKLMNEVWIGVVFTLIMISLVFCVCSCFLYHQFRTWKKNFNATAVRAQAGDLEAMKLNPDYPEDPVPSYTLVSGLPSYDAALELLHKNPNGCVFVYPTVFSVFNKQGISCNDLAELMTTPPLAAAAITAATFGVQQQQHQPIYETHRSLMAAERAVRSFSPYDGSIINENNSNENNNNENHSNETNNNETSINGNIKTNDNITSNINTNDSNIPRYADAATTTATLAPPPPPPTTTINMILSEQCSPSDLATVEEVGAAASTRTTTKPFRVAPTYPVLQIVHSYEEAEALLVASDVRF